MNSIKWDNTGKQETRGITLKDDNSTEEQSN